MEENCHCPKKIKLDIYANYKDESILSPTIDNRSVTFQELGRIIVNELTVKYQAAEQLFNQQEYEAAEYQFIEILKQFLPQINKVAQNIQVKDFQMGIYNSFIKLSEIYALKDSNFAQTAALWQYTDAFGKKYMIGSESLNEIHRNAHLQELNYIKKYNENSSVTVDELILETEGYKRDLGDLRALVKKNLVIVETKALETKALYHSITKTLFLNSDNEQKGVIVKIIENTIKQLGEAPAGCEYSVISLGSSAIGVVTPWSDFEFAIIISEDKQEYKEYFNRLTELMYIKFINLGETLLRNLRIPAFNNIKSGIEEEDWFFDDIINKGLSFDGPSSGGCKLPWGRQGYKVKVGDNLVDKPDYSLILTIEQLMTFQSGDKIACNKTWFESDPHLVQSLLNVSLVYGSQKLLDQYRQNLREFATENIEINKQRYKEILKQDIEKFSLKLGSKEDGKLVHVKDDIYRIIDRIIVDLVNYFNILPEESESGIDIWGMIDKIKASDILNEEGAKNLTEALSIATQMRLLTYSYNHSQKNMLSTYVPRIEHFAKEFGDKIAYETFLTKDKDSLYQFYRVILRLQKIIADFCWDQATKDFKNILFKDNLYYSDDYIDGMIYARFLEYDKSLVSMEKSYIVNQHNIHFLYDFLALYETLENWEASCILAQEILKLIEAQHITNDAHIDFANIYHKIGYIESRRGKYDNARNSHHKAINIIQENLHQIANPDFHKAQSYKILGDFNLYRAQGEIKNETQYYQKAITYYQKAITYYQKALQNFQEYYGKETQNLSIAEIYQSLGSVFFKQGHLQEAIDSLQMSLGVNKEYYARSPNSPCLARTYSETGKLYVADGSLEKALESHFLALNIRKTFFSSVSHPLIAKSYIHIGDIYTKKSEYDHAIYYYNIACNILTKDHYGCYHQDIIKLFDRIGDFYYQNGDLKISEYFLCQAIELKSLARYPELELIESYSSLINKFLKDTMNKTGIAGSYYSKICNIFVKLDLDKIIKQNNYDKYRTYIESTYQALQESDELKEEFKEFYDFYKKFSDYTLIPRTLKGSFGVSQDEYSNDNSLDMPNRSLPNTDTEAESQMVNYSQQAEPESVSSSLFLSPVHQKIEIDKSIDANETTDKMFSIPRLTTSLSSSQVSPSRYKNYSTEYFFQESPVFGYQSCSQECSSQEGDHTTPIMGSVI